MAETIQIKRSNTAGVVPSSLAVGELAANIPDQKLFLGNASGAPVDLLGRYLPRTGGVSTGEQVFAPSGAGSGARFSNGQVGVSHYMDSVAYYILLTGAGSPLSTTYTAARPFVINLTSGLVSMNQGLSVAGGLSADTLNLSNDLSIANGGTGASTAAAALAALGGMSANNTSFTGNSFTFGTANNATTTAIEFGSTVTSGTTYLDWHSSGSNNDFDVRLAATGGTAGTTGGGAFDIRAAGFTLNGNAVLNAGTPVTLAQGGTGSTTAAGARMALGLAAVAASGTYADLLNPPAIPGPSGAAPLMDGATSGGASALYSRADHVHPTDTSRAPVNNPNFGGNAFAFGAASTASNMQFEIGSASTANYLYFDLHSSGTNNDFDVRIDCSGGTATSGQGNYGITGASFKFNGANVLTAAAPVTVAQGGTGATSAAGARTALGAAASTTPAIAGAPVITVGADLVGRRSVTGNYGVVDYFDGGSYYFLVTNSGQQATTNYSGIRPYSINLTSGLFSVGNGLAVAGGLTTDSLTLTGAGLNVTTQGGSTSRTLAAHLSDQVSLLDFGAVGNGTADDTAAIQAALNAVANGVNVLAPPLTYKVTGTLTLGNGSSSAASTRWGITLRGLSPAPYPAEMFSGFPNTGTARFVWAGASGGTMFKVAGPLNSWGLSNLYLDGASLAGVGIDVVSASNGDSRGLTLTNFTNAAIRENCLASYTGFGLANSMHNSYDNLAFYLPNVQGAKAVVQTGQPTATGPGGAPAAAVNSCFAKFSNVTINAPGGTNATFGFYLQWTDTNYYEDIHYFGGNANSACFFFDYTLKDNLPSANTIVCIDPSGNGIDSGAFVNAGTPGLGSRPNYVKGIGQINNAKIPNILGLYPDLPFAVQRLDLTGQTQPITNSQVFIPYETGLYRTSFYLRLSNAGATGTLTARITTNDGVGPVNLDLNPSVNATGGATFGTIIYRAIGGSPVNYSIVFQNTSTSPTYNMSMSTERIG